MLRKRGFRPRRTKKQIIQAEKKIEQTGTSILDITDSVLIDILLRFPIKSIIMCKCVCKPWHRVISDPNFAKMHFARAEPCPLIRTLGGSGVSRMLYLIEPSEININYAGEKAVDLRLDTRLKIPLRNIEMLPENDADDYKLCSRGSNCNGSFKRRCVKVTAKEQKFHIVNSCNGFLCLSDPLNNNPLVVCNPVTGEYLNLPKTNEFDESSKDMMTCGFGISNKSNQYTVLRMLTGKRELCCCPITGKEIFSSQMAEVHVLGTSSWRCIGHAPYSGKKLKFMIYLSGSVYWACDESRMIYSFDFDEAKFRAIEPPPYADMWPAGWYKVALGMLVGRLSLCRTSISSDEVRVWILETNGELTAWKEFKTIHLGGDDSVFFYSRLEFGLCKYFRIQLAKAKFAAVTYIPSFICLKDVVQGDWFEILNVNSE
ncbi:OLC1v1025215C1 [Oldenlandia corymbosa var. corymbosa]|uniref:OLC1v1025215C1 n=1 Tax=Oldenlandia corymbosa var. corymbosa TaxID=529605 RepID=A0AAV1C4Q9_OLDCO|nr:OLC1v1025215C1 [Oldenlandia corymbosa var. corymbosa]